MAQGGPSVTAVELRRTAAGLRRALGPAADHLADVLVAAADQRIDTATALGRLARVLVRSGEGAAALLVAADADLELLRWLAHLDDEHLRSTAVDVAGRQGLLAWLARDRSPDVRRAVAAQVPVGSRLLAHLCTDDDAGVREQVAARDTVPEDIASILARDEAWQVRFALAATPGLPGSVVRRLADDPDRRVRARIGARPTRGTGTAHCDEVGVGAEALRQRA